MKRANKIELSEVIRTISECLENGPEKMLRVQEARIGARFVDPKLDKWFNPDDWWGNPVISIKGPKVRIVVIVALIPNTGAFSRLIHGILKAGLDPQVIAPTGDMVFILTWWGWKKKTIGTTFEDIQEIWEPSKKNKNHIKK